MPSPKAQNSFDFPLWASHHLTQEHRNQLSYFSKTVLGIYGLKKSATDRLNLTLIFSFEVLLDFPLILISKFLIIFVIFRRNSQRARKRKKWVGEECGTENLASGGQALVISCSLFPSLEAAFYPIN